MSPQPCPRIALLFAFLLGLFQPASGLFAQADPEWRPSFSIPGLSPYSPVVVSERHRTLIRTSPGSTEVVVQDYRTGETNRVINLPAGAASMAISPDHQWLYVTFFEPPGPPGLPATNLMEINLVTLDEPRLISTPYHIARLLATDSRLVILNVYGPNNSAAYQLRVLDAASGRLGTPKTVSSYPVVSSAEQNSVFALGTVAQTMEETFRHSFDPETLGWISSRRFPVIKGEEGNASGFPFAYTTDRKLLLTPVGIYTNTPDTSATDLRRLAHFGSYNPLAAYFDPQVPKFGFVGEQHGVSLLRTDRWEPAKSYPLGNTGSQGAIAYGRDGEDVVAVYFLEGDPDAKVARLRPPLELLTTNSAPIAQLTVPAGPLTTAEPLLLDASASRDDVTESSRLRFRWDLDGDGTFDTPFTDSPVLLHRFALPGMFSVRVEVADELGERAQASVAFEVQYAPKPATPIAPDQQQPWQFDFGVAAAVFDLPRNRAFALDYNGKRVIEISTLSGLATREFSVDSAIVPPALALSPDGRQLYCAEIHAKPLQPTDYGNSYLVQFDLEAGVRAREIFVGGYVGSVVVLTNQYLAYPAGARIEVRHWPDAAPTASVAIGNDAATMLAAGPDGAIYWRQINDATLTLRRRIFSPEIGTLATPASVAVKASQAFVIGNGNFVLLDSGNLRALTPKLATDFGPVTNLVAEPFLYATDLPDPNLVVLRGGGHWEFVRISDWSRLVIQPAGTSAAVLSFAAGNHEFLYELRYPNATGGTTLERRRMPATDLEHNEPPMVTWDGVTNLIQLGTNVVVTASATDDDGAVSDFDLLVNGVALPPLPAGFPPVPGRKQWRWQPTSFGTYLVQLVAKDNLGAVTRLPERAVRVNQAPTVDFAAPYAGRKESPVSFALPVVALDADDHIVRVEGSYTPVGGQRRLFGVLTAPPFVFPVAGLAGRDGAITVTVTDEGGAKAAKTVALQLDPPPGDNYAKPLPLVGTTATVGYAARQMSSDQVSLMDFPDPTVETVFGGVWWQWSAPADLAVQIDTLGSSFDTVLRVITTNRPAHMVDESADDPFLAPASRVKFTAEAGQTFLIGVFGQRATDTGDIRLNLRSSPWVKPEATDPPPNDLFSGRITLETGVPTSGTTRGARREPQEPSLGSRSTNTVWYQWTAPDGGWARIELSSTNMDPRLTLYLGATNLGRLRLIDSKDDNSLQDNSVTWTVPVIAGTNYALRVNGMGPYQGEFSLAVRFPVAPPDEDTSPHDRLALARTVTGDLVEFASNSRTATTEPGLPAALQLAEAVNGVWWRWTPEAEGYAYWSLRRITGASVQTLTRRVVVLGAGGTLQVIAPGPGSSAADATAGAPLQWPTVAGTTYYLFAGTSVGRNPADFRFFLNNQMRPAPPELQAPRSVTGGGLRLSLVSPFERRAVLESSIDLQLWRSSGLYNLLEGTNLVELPPDEVSGPAFFRLRSDD